MLADTVGSVHPLYAPARYLAAIVTGSAAAILQGVNSGALTPEQIDEAHAWSELNCHRAAEIRGWVDSVATSGDGLVSPFLNLAGSLNKARGLMRSWAEEDRLFTTHLIGGEYEGGWLVHGTSHIERKTPGATPSE